MAKYYVEVYQCLKETKIVEQWEYKSEEKANRMADKCRKFYYPQEYFKTKVRKVEG